MYNDTIKVVNKIISDEDLSDIFFRMQEKLKYWKKVNASEELQNKMLDYKYQNWRFKDNGSKLQFDIDFYDNTLIKFDDYNNFMAVFNSRLEEIKRIYVRFFFSYSVEKEGQKQEWYSQHINMWICETKIDIDVSLSSDDKKIDDIYDLLKNKILNAPPKYDETIKKKSSITTIVGLAIGFIPALILNSALLFVPTIRQIFVNTYVLYPVCCLLFAFIIGGIIGSSKLDGLYKNIVPSKKYAGYDSINYKSIYKDDIENYVGTSEILIGQNVENLECRKQIIEYRNKYKKFIPYEVGIMLLVSIIVLLLGVF